MRRTFRSAVPVLASIVVLAAAQTARADEAPNDANIAARRGLIEQAQASREQGDHARALDLATRAGRIGMSTSLRRFIAEEEEALAMPAEALGTAELCVREGSSDAAQEAHVAACRSIVERAKAAVGRLVVRLDPAPEGAFVRVRGVDVPRAVWGAPYVVSPGVVEVEAGAPGYAVRKTTVEIARGAVAEVALALEPSASTSSGASTTPSSDGSPSSNAPTTPHAGSEGRRSLSPLVPIGGAVALVGAGVALGVGLAARGRLDDYESRCTVAGAPGACAADHRALTSDLDTSALVVNIAIGAAIAGAVTCAVGFVLGMRPPSRTARAPALALEF